MKILKTLLVILTISTLTHAQNNNFSNLWNEVNRLEAQGLPKSALKIVEKIETLANAKNNSVQQIKVMLFKSKFALLLEEDAQLKIINSFKTQIHKASFPKKNILESILANLYWQYYQQNRWKFYNRTKTENKVDTTDFRTWDIQTLFNEIKVHFNNSLQNALEAQHTPLENFKDILIAQPDSKKYRPTLYDFLAHQALEFYQTNENNITQPAYKFNIDKPEYLSPTDLFINLQITSKDSTSLQLKALQIYQNLIKFHKKDNTPYALTQVNIERLNFTYQNSVFNAKENILLTTLKTEKQAIKNHETSTLYDFEIATILYQQAQNYNPKNEETHPYQWKNKEALALCNNAIQNFPESLGAKKCVILQNTILQSALSLTTARYLPINTPSRIRVNYKNINHLNFTVYKVTPQQIIKLNKIYNKKEKQSFIKNLQAVKNWESNLKTEGDYQSHATEVVLPKLANGNYVIYTYNKNKEAFAFSTIQITDFALVQTNNSDKNTYQIINRNNGNPIANAFVKMTYKTSYNSGVKTKNFTTDNTGSFIVKKGNQYLNSINFNITHKDQTAYFGEYYSYRYYKNNEENESKIKAFTFTDRSIYRPGQRVYFKSIILQSENNKSKVIPNTLINATLHDANNQEISKLELKTNEFGSVSGEFILPNNGLTGNFYIEIYSDEIEMDMEETYFSVEEYKRPKFEAKFNTVTQSYKINDTVTLKGEALAYSGAKITDAKVVYRVKRNVQFPRWYYWYRPWFSSEPQEITHGETQTNENGEFEIDFKAIPDTKTDKKNLPVFTYEITADITDLNGETRSATTQVRIGYHSLLATVTSPSKIDKSENKTTISIDTKNLNDAFVPAKGTILVYKLIPPKQVLRERPWEAPDYQMLTKEEFKAHFPHDAYTNEDNYLNWEKGTLAYKTSFNTEAEKEITLKNIKKWQSGWYVILLETQDKFGQKVTDKEFTYLYSTKDKTVADNQLFTIHSDKDFYKPGDKSTLVLGSAADNLWVTIFFEKKNKPITKQIIQLSNNKKTISVPITKEDLGGFVISYSYAFANSFYEGELGISVPYPSNELQIEANTFRNKLQPGQKETWSFTLKGPKGEKVSAEMLASMYDASLDQFKPHNWSFHPIFQQIFYKNTTISSNTFGTKNFTLYTKQNEYQNYPKLSFDQLNWFGFYFLRNYNPLTRALEGKAAGVQIESEESVPAASNKVAIRGMVSSISDEKEKSALDEVVVTGVAKNEEKVSPLTSDLDNIKVRKNLQETAFFFPHLRTDAKGNCTFSFTTPEALTQWKLQVLAHTKTLQSAVKQFTALTQKELMVTPNLPRFFREGDTLTIQSKVSNITDKDLFGEAKITFYDALTNNDITSQILLGANFEVFKEATNVFPFTLPAKQNTSVSWKIFIPENFGAITTKIVAKAGNFSDGEQSTLPVLTNRMLVTETLPMWIRSNQTKTFTLNKLKDNSSTTLKNHKLTLEVTSNPAWYAVQALPYLMEYPYECNEQTFARYYANALASYIVNSNPKIQEVFNQWKNSDALLSNLEKNQELKALLIQETPWLRDAQSETEQKKRIALLFDLNKMNNELERTSNKLLQNQMSNGAWSWFKGGRENRFITQHIITGIGHLKKLGVQTENIPQQAIKNAVKYLDEAFIQEYENIKRYNPKADYKKDHLSYSQIQYLYMRSFFSEIKMSKKVSEIRSYYLNQIHKYWLSKSLYAKGMMALISLRENQTETTKQILKSLKETSITSDELGMYWKENTASWYWYQAPIETQALLIEVFSEAGTVLGEQNTLKDIDNLKIWLLKNKQTNRWKTTKATTEAVYALLLQGSDWLSVNQMVDVQMGNTKIEPQKLEDTKIEAGTGYFKTSWNASEIKPELATVTLTKKGKGIAWGALYWQYFEDLDKITPAKTPLQLSKKLFIKKNTDTGEQLTEITNKSTVKVGDLVRVRIVLKVDRPMEFVHLKDMRASGFEPVNVLSRYKWQDGLGYYESTKDATTNFFFDYLPKGVYVFEYDVRANNAGNFSNGISTIQSMYAPEFSSHSEGVRVNID